VKGVVSIDCFPESADKYRSSHAIVAIDVIRATTTATTALDRGRRVFPARTADEATIVASRLENALLVGELGGNMPVGFDATNSPAEMSQRTDTHRPMVLVSSSGTQLMMNAVGAEGVYLACLRNYSAVARLLASRHTRIAVIGAGTRGQFRREDQIGCALVAKQLLAAGFRPENEQTEGYLARWSERSMPELLEVVGSGKSAQYLRGSNQEADLEFVLSHVDDLDLVPRLLDGELTTRQAPYVVSGQAGAAAQLDGRVA
jgi:2-phosphosulfolactate phosphatase